MFLEPFNKNDVNIILENFNIFQKDYYDAVTEGNFLDYSSVKTGIKDMIANPSNSNSHWQVFPLWYKFNPWEGRENLKTIEVLKKLQIRPLQAAFSKLLPNTILPWHEDHDESSVHRFDTSIIKYHLTLSNPGIGDSGLEIKDKENRILKEGDLNIFDESMTHRAWNNSDKERGVLLISFLRSDIDV